MNCIDVLSPILSESSFSRSNIFGSFEIFFVLFFLNSDVIFSICLTLSFFSIISLALLIASVSYTHLRAHETRHDLVCRLLLEKKLSVRQIEKITSEFKKNKTKKILKDPNITDLEKELSDKIGLKTSIQFNENGSSGSLTLYYSDLNQLDDLMKRLKK